MSDFEPEVCPGIPPHRFCQKSRETAIPASQSAQIQLWPKKSKDRATFAACAASDLLQTACGYQGAASIDIVTCQRGRDSRSNSQSGVASFAPSRVSQQTQTQLTSQLRFRQMTHLFSTRLQVSWCPQFGLRSTAPTCNGTVGKQITRGNTTSLQVVYLQNLS